MVPTDDFSEARSRLSNEHLLAYRDRKQRKRAFRRLWIVRINAAARTNGLTYSKLMHQLKSANIDLDRRVLADLAANDPSAFSALVNTANNAG